MTNRSTPLNKIILSFSLPSIYENAVIQLRNPTLSVQAGAHARGRVEGAVTCPDTWKERKSVSVRSDAIHEAAWT
jgi:hypothetical protein